MAQVYMSPFVFAWFEKTHGWYPVLWFLSCLASQARGWMREDLPQGCWFSGTVFCWNMCILNNMNCSQIVGIVCSKMKMLPPQRFTFNRTLWKFSQGWNWRPFASAGSFQIEPWTCKVRGSASLLEMNLHIVILRTVGNQWVLKANFEDMAWTWPYFAHQEAHQVNPKRSETMTFCHAIRGSYGISIDCLKLSELRFGAILKVV